MMIKSRQNETIKWLFKLQQKKYRDESDSFLVYGDHGVKEAIKTDRVIDIYTSNRDKEGILISEDLMNKLSPFKSPVDILAVVNKAQPWPYSKKILLLDGVQDPGNLGTLIRSAVGFEFTTIIASNDTVDFYNEKTISASQGNLFYANLIRTDLSLEIKKLKEKGYNIIATDANNGKNLKKINKNDKIGLILGNEGTGIKEEVMALANDYIKIKTTNIESLNVAIAGSIIMYEVSDFND